MFQTITDVDIIGLRLPGPVYIADSHSKGGSPALLVEDPVLEHEEDTIDVIIGEVKQGEAVFNPGLTDHHTLHTVLQRVSWLYELDVHDVARDLGEHLVCRQATHGGTIVRTRLVAFGRSPVNNLNTISLPHIFNTMVGTRSQDRGVRGRISRAPSPRRNRAQSVGLVAVYLIRLSSTHREPRNQ